MILKELRNTGSSTAKRHILQTMADTFDKKMFQYAYSPDLTYGVKYNYIHWDGVRQPSQMDFILLDKLIHRKLVGNGARTEIDNHCREYGDLVKLICNKDLDCGVTATTLNEVFGKGFILLFEVQLAKEVTITKLTLPMVGQIKYNGVRVVAHIRKDGVTFRTRNGKYFAFPELAKRLHKGHGDFDKDIILDGELTYGDSKGLDHTGISGVVNSAIKGNPIKDIRQDIVFTVFDIMEISDFYKQDCRLVYKDRFRFLDDYIHYLWEGLSTEEARSIQIAKSFIFNSYEDIQIKFKELLEEGYEGLILKSWNHYYSFKRSTDWVKLKATNTADLLCTDVLTGKGKYSGMVGSLICKGMVEGREVTVNVGSGLSDADRSLSFTHYIDHKIEVKYNSVILDKVSNLWSLFLPRFNTIRGDL